MKVITMILSLVIFVLSIKPCSEENNTEDKHQDEISINHNHLNECDDSCPITCVCNCCGMSIAYLFIENFNLELDIKIPTLDFSSYQSNYYFDYHFNIWQPPQFIS